MEKFNFKIGDFTIETRGDWGSSDMCVFTEIIKENCYRIDPHYFDKIKTVIDIGGHIGIFSLMCAPYVNKITTYEPSKDNFLLLKQNIETNNLQNKIIAYNTAVSDQNGTIAFYPSKASNARHTIIPPGQIIFETQGDKIEVQSITLYDAVERINFDPCFLKIDTEGGEYQILLSADKKVFENIHRIVIETHEEDGYKYNREDIIKFLNSLGYKTRWIFNWIDAPTKFTAGVLLAWKE